MSLLSSPADARPDRIASAGTWYSIALDPANRQDESDRRDVDGEDRTAGMAAFDMVGHKRRRRWSCGLPPLLRPRRFFIGSNTSCTRAPAVKPRMISWLHQNRRLRVCYESTLDHLEAWVRRQGWSPSMRRSAINYVMAAFNDCLKRKKVKENPIHGIQKPHWERRRQIISPEDERKIHDASYGPFRAILTVLRTTGARPGELCGATIDQYRDGTITLTAHKEDETGEDRVIYLQESARVLVEEPIGNRLEGPIFRNAKGEFWTPDTLYCRFKRLRKRLGLGAGVFPYSLRHRFASDAINSGNINPALVARALGHAGLEVLMKNYFRENPDAVRHALEGLERK